ncbi:unnamed protein product [Oncorhynchus mykiss]|uniref:Galectin n=1 Tax=Oncorhynchus mykiss TaxID=8022 RepID=A0A060X714_ONCMY|nr:unnamed protein product [Oncorhynchus mykiss]
MAPFIFSFTRISRPGPFAEKQPQSMMFPPPCFTVANFRRAWTCTGLSRGKHLALQDLSPWRRSVLLMVGFVTLVPALCRSFTRSPRVVLGFLLTVLVIILTPRGEILCGAPDRGRLSVVLYVFHFLIIAPTVDFFKPSCLPIAHLVFLAWCSSLMLCVAVRPLVLSPREATASGPARTKQGVLPGRHSPPSPHLAGLGNPTPPAGLGHNHPNQPQLQPKTGLVAGYPRPYPRRSGWPFSPGQSGWPGQNPGGFTPAPQWTPTPAGRLSVPYNLNLQRGIYDKMMITIMGRVKPNAKQFTVNFVRGNDIAFHLNPRFNDGGKQAVVRNTMVGERWGKEERHTQGGFPFMAGQSFEMKILVTFEEFKVAVNGAQLFEFKHRVRELNQIDRINILHDVILTYVNVDTIP